MNFFEHQDQARKRTGHLILLFGLAVLTLIIMTALLFAAFLGFVNAEQSGSGAAAFLEQLNTQNFALVALGVLAVVGGGTLFKLAQLSAGGKVVAEMMGGTRIDLSSSKDADERKLLNVVEEMAIASGTPVPPVYVMQDEQGINAFAAGFNANDAVIGITRGCIETLNRDELQGVIAHEFSHILHGDMRINIRLMGILHGILLIGLIGYQLLDKLWWSSRSSKKDNGAIGIIALAIGLIVIGFGGVFFGNLIKAAVSRQREYLADASAVQFTRNPDGIANALKKIGGHSSSTLLQAENTEATSHMLFGSGSKRLLNGLFATHPPLEERIRTIEPRWDGKFLSAKPKQARSKDKSTQTEKPSGLDKLKTAASAAILAEQAINNIGNPQAEHLEQAQTTLNGLPQDWHQQAQSAQGARAAVYTLLIDEQPDIAKHQLQHIRNLDADSLATVQSLLVSRGQLEDQYRLSVIDIALPQVAKSLDKGAEGSLAFDDFSQLVDSLIRADQRISLFEWSLFAILMHYLKPLQGKIKAPVSKHRELDKVFKECQMLFSILAIAGNKKEDQAKAFAAAKDKSGLDKLQLLPSSELSIGQMSDTLENLNKLYPLAKPKLLKACVACICADGEVTSTEAELIRAIGDTLDCPMPPIVVNH